MNSVILRVTRKQSRRWVSKAVSVEKAPIGKLTYGASFLVGYVFGGLQTIDGADGADGGSVVLVLVLVPGCWIFR